MPAPRLKQIAQGIFFSLLDYCIEVYGNTHWMYTLDIAQHSGKKIAEGFKLLSIKF